MNFFECISITAALTSIIHFTSDGILCCFQYEEEITKSDDKLL